MSQEEQEQQQNLLTQNVSRPKIFIPGPKFPWSQKFVFPKFFLDPKGKGFT